MMEGGWPKELVFGREKVTSGAASTSSKRQTARMMVTRGGLSDEWATSHMGKTRRKSSR